MNLLAPIAPSTIAATAAVLGGLLIVAYILKMRRRRFEVPFSMLWQRVLKEKEARSLWRHLKRLLSLLLLLLMTGTLLFAALEPELGDADEDARAVVIIVDASASMKARDGGEGETRLELAKRKVTDILAGMTANDAVMIMRMDGRSTPLSRFQNDIPKLRKVVTDLEASDTPADLRATLSAAADALRFRKDPLLIIVGDGAYPDEVLKSVSWEAPDAQAGGDKTEGTGDKTAKEASQNFTDKRLDLIDLSGIDVRYQPVGSAKNNVAIVAFNVRRYISNKLNYEVYIQLQNFGDAKAKRRLVLFHGSDEIDVKEIEIPAGQQVTKIYKDLSGDSTSSILRAKIEALTEADEDVFALDDEAWALIPENKSQKVLWVGEPNEFMQSALDVFDHLQVQRVSVEEYEATTPIAWAGSFDAVIYHDYTPEKPLPPPVHLMYFKPEGEHSPFPVGKPLERGRITEVSRTHPVMRWIEMQNVNFDGLGTFAVDPTQAEVPLAMSIRSVVAAAKKDGRQKIVALGFSLSNSDIMMRVAFPVLMVNTMDWFAGADSDLITTYKTGEPARVPLDGTYAISEVDVETPSERHQRAPVQDGYATFFATEVGVHRLSAMADGEEVAAIQLASNLSNPQESEIEPSSELLLGGVKLKRPEYSIASVGQSMWQYLVLMVGLLLLVEWYTFNRRITV